MYDCMSSTHMPTIPLNCMCTHYTYHSCCIYVYNYACVCRWYSRGKPIQRQFKGHSPAPGSGLLVWVWLLVPAVGRGWAAADGGRGRRRDLGGPGGHWGGVETGGVTSSPYTITSSPYTITSSPAHHHIITITPGHWYCEISLQVSTSDFVDVDYLTPRLDDTLEMVATSNSSGGRVRLDELFLDFCLPCDLSDLHQPGQLRLLALFSVQRASLITPSLPPSLPTVQAGSL